MVVVRKWFLIATLLTLLLLVAPVQAGCCLVVTLDSLPGVVRAGEEVQVGFMVRVNQTPIAGQHPFLVAVNPESGEQLEVAAQPGEKTGHYVATVVFPADGLWEWELRMSQSGAGHELAPLTVLPPAAAAAAAVAPTIGAETVRAALRWMALALALAASLLLLRDRLQSSVAAAPRTGKWLDT